MMTRISQMILFLPRLSKETPLTKRVKHNMKHTQTARPTQPHCTLIDCLKSFWTNMDYFRYFTLLLLYNHLWCSTTLTYWWFILLCLLFRSYLDQIHLSRYAIKLNWFFNFHYIFRMHDVSLCNGFILNVHMIKKLSGET